MRSAKNYLLSCIFLCNLAQGMFLIGVSKALFDLTGSASAFTGIFIVQIFCQLLVNFGAGLLVDRCVPQKALAFTCSSLGMIFGLGALAFQLSWGAVGVALLLMVASAVGVAFLHIGLFALCGSRLSAEVLRTFYAEQAVCIQTGQILGGVAVGLLIYQSSTTLVLYAIAGAYTGAAFIYGVLLNFRSSNDQPASAPCHRDSSQETSRPSIVLIIAQLREFFLQNPHARMLLVWSALPYLLVNCLNIALVPMVARYAQGNALYLSWFDSAFACGAIVGGLAYRRWHHHLPAGPSPWWLLGGCGGIALVFQLIPEIAAATWLLTVPIVALGILATVASTRLTTLLQQLARAEIRGSIAGAQQTCNAVVSALLLPIFTVVLAASPTAAWWVPAAVALLWCVVLRAPAAEVWQDGVEGSV